VVAAVMGALFVAALVVGVTEMLHVWELQREIDGLERDVAALRAHTERLASTVDRLRNDPAYIEKLAREELGYVREGETVLKFPSAGK
jgi:cell division protein FtsB